MTSPGPTNNPAIEYTEKTAVLRGRPLLSELVDFLI